MIWLVVWGENKVGGIAWNGDVGGRLFSTVTRGPTRYYIRRTLTMAGGDSNCSEVALGAQAAGGLPEVQSCTALEYTLVLQGVSKGGRLVGAR